ncbi:amidohydrolase [Streptomyces acidiscabies]|uniref:Amidohydrolase n=1 Tax=Streptomyces acidiscabies TaxID=42234 RepID=A0AAP6BA85_9ACTN|nr:amidohydrolase [Streptomyces acidiscabies]MBZ3916589.1 amidohydrolase [Streptomyces acidiscabies]MDX2961036.1 amidohydrolase [Streptomyces acidiscabies]MDX3020267.1 amidohydrolase [Streptomyces acidiscabies]MDX3791743.1 amidohydrolase [Streptomyces acidiscabies]GAQ57991.1 putative hydrolase YxeP [Streptomyces acidiscabies]
MSAPHTLDLTAALKAADLEDFYQDLHRHPELAFEEHRTAGRLAARLKTAGYEVTEGVGGTGVVGVLRNGDGPVVWLRADMDALPVREATGLLYASTVDGVMHACGHDLHVTWLAAAAEALAGGRDVWAGTVVAIGQPGEEAGSGAAAMVADGLHQRFPRPDAVLGQHAAPGPVGFYPHTPGLTMSASDDIDVVVHGVGGHGSRPESTVDPVVIGSYIVTRLQTVVAREIAASESAVLTVGAFQAGATHNVIPAEARLALNLRTQNRRTRDKALDAIRRIVTGECGAAGCPQAPEVDVVSSYPVTVNDAALDGRIAETHRQLFGEHTVFDFGPVMGSEDFSELAPEGVPYDYWYVTTTPADVWEAAQGEELREKFANVPGNHSPLFAPDLSALVPGAQTLVSAALTVLLSPGTA